MKSNVRQNNNQVLPSRLAGLDCLRFFAAMLALAYHYLFRGNREGNYLSVGFDSVSFAFKYAYFGVPLFFMISGFVIIWSTENKNWFEFGVGRLIRLWPGYILAASITAIVVMLHNTYPFQTSVAHWLANLSFVAPAFGYSFMDGVYWTIVLELVFYFWVTVGVMAGVLSRNLLEICLAWMVLILANEMWLDSGLLRAVAITAYGGWFLVGVLSYRLWSQGWSSATVLMLAVAIELSVYHAMVEHTAVSATYHYANDYLSVALIAITCILLFLSTVYWGHKIQPSRMVFVLGGITYPLYLVHQHVGYILIERFSGALGKWGALILTTSLMLALAYAIFQWWERPVSKAMLQFLPRANSWRERLMVLGRKIRAV